MTRRVGLTPDTPDPPEPILTCTGCGQPRDPTGYCSSGAGYDGNLAHPPGLVCPSCRRPLDWNGSCYGCRTAPGDGWVWLDGHYVLDRDGPGREATLDEAKAALTAIATRIETLQAEGKAGPLAPLLLQVAARMKSGQPSGLTEPLSPEFRKPVTPEPRKETP